MPVAKNEQIRKNWGFRKGPGVLLAISTGLLGITILAWRSEVSWRGPATAAFVLVIFVLLFFSRQVSCTFNLDEQLIHLQRRSIWKRSSREITFDEVDTVGVVSSSSGTHGGTHQVVLALRTGEQIPLTPHPSSGKIPKELLARRIASTLDQFRPVPVNLALHGVIKVIRAGDTRGRTWQLELITANDSATATHWSSSQAPFLGGFLLLIPSKADDVSGAQDVSRGVRFFYQQYLRGLGITAAQVPGFEEAQFLGTGANQLGGRFSCLSNDPLAAERWLRNTGSERLSLWIDHQMLPGGKGEREPHLLATPEGFRLIFRRLYYQDEDLSLIADLGASMAEAYSKS